MPGKGHFITLEGGEGAGKSTMADAIEAFVRDRVTDRVMRIREPGGTPIAEDIRKILKSGHGEERLCDMAELLLMYAARAQLVEGLVRPRLEEGYVIIGDRHDLSTVAYQGGGRGIPMDTLDTLRRLSLGSFRPDLTILMDIEPLKGMERARTRGELDRIEREGTDFFERVRKAYLEAAARDDTIRTVDAGRDVDEVRRSVLGIVASYFGVDAT